MLKCKDSQLLLNDLSWEVLGQTVVDTTVQLPNVDIAILYLNRFDLDTEEYFFGLKNYFSVNRYSFGVKVGLERLKLLSF